MNRIFNMRNLKLPALLLLLAPLTAAAGDGSYVEVYGTSITDDDVYVQVVGKDALGAFTAMSAEFSADASVEYGIRGVLETAGMPWLFGADLGRFSTGTNCCITLDVPSFAIFGGWQPVDPWLGKVGGGVRPYLLGGIAVPFIDGTAHSTNLTVEIGNTSGSFSGVSPYVVAGFAWELTRHFGIVAEYRYRRFTFNGEQPNEPLYPDEDILTDGNIDASGVSVGFRWNLPESAGAR